MNQSKNILITGASTGIGYDLCHVLVKKGYIVYGSVRKQADADKLSAELGPGFKPLLFDVTDHAAVDSASEKVFSEIGQEGLAGLVNNAGIAVGGPLQLVGIDELRYQFEVNVIGLMKVTQAFLPMLGARENHSSKPGRILQISSVSGKMASPFVGPYVSSKHALEGLSGSLRRELQLYGIDVIVIGPGPVKTPIWYKSASPEVEAKYIHSPYGEALKIFRNKFIRRSVETGLESPKLAEEIVSVFEKKKPKTRYTYTNHKFQNWILPRLLPARVVDKFLGEKLKLIK
jgi:NAD(P)-dependent dehydrogenase (short-subunit alcohol dehydrogenase family)